MKRGQWHELVDNSPKGEIGGWAGPQGTVLVDGSHLPGWLRGYDHIRVRKHSPPWMKTSRGGYGKSLELPYWT